MDQLSRRGGAATGAAPASIVRVGETIIAAGDLISTSLDIGASLPEADITVCCTSSADRLFSYDALKTSAVVCDISRPPNVGDDIRWARPDVLALEGGVVRLPGATRLSFGCSLPPGRVYACMAETMMLAMEQRWEDASLGFDLALDYVLQIERLAAECGFEIMLQPKGEKAAPRIVISRQQARVFSATAGSVLGV
jgi:predicted amino acid dehydrogenase